MTERVTPVVGPNPEVIELLESYLEIAREQPRFAHCAIVMTAHPGVAALDFAGEISLQESTLEALTGCDYVGKPLPARGEWLAGKISQSISKWKLPPRNEHLDESFVVYNIANGPLGFDFVVWLVEAEMTRIRKNAPGPLVVGFFKGRQAETHVDRYTAQRRNWLNNVMRPALKLIGAVEDMAAIGGHYKDIFVTRDICRAARAGFEVPKLRAPPNDIDPIWRQLPDQYVTITLREATNWPHRNSNIDEWLKFADYLTGRGENVVFVRDTAKADEPIEGYLTCPEASRDLIRRMELYERARCNLFVSNGPAVLGVFGSRPWLEFVRLEPEDSGYAPDTPIFWAKHHGVAVGTQYPWSAPDQCLVWKPDTYENMVEAWNAHITPRLETVEASAAA